MFLPAALNGGNFNARNLMSEFRLPLSGNVNQTINPWTWMFSSVGSQFGLINVNMGQSSDPVLEARIIDQVGTYGKQIGQLGDAIRVLLDQFALKYPELELEKQDAVKDVRRQLDHIDSLKQKRKAELPPISTGQ
jgi:hypothetical protein